jgi:hypothetical protein
LQDYHFYFTAQQEIEAIEPGLCNGVTPEVFAKVMAALG